MGVLLLAACASPQPTATPLSTSTIAPTMAPTQTSTPTLTNTPEPLFSFRILSYNILYGAGTERQFDSALPPEMVGKSRLPELLSVIQNANPDIVGLQEANGWDRGTPPMIQQVAQTLGMNQFFARTAGGFHLGLLTKFTILDAENLSSDIGRQGALRATLVSPQGERLVIFVVHLDPASPDARLCEVNTLLQAMQPYANSRTILIGDMNFRLPSREYSRLEQAGWRSVAVEPSWGIDQIWISSSVNWSNSAWFQSLATPAAISDHQPIGAEIKIYSQLALPSSTTPTPSTTITPTVEPIPIFATNALTDVRVLRQERFNDPCAASRWNLGIASAKFANAMLEVNGVETWQSLVSRHRELVEGQGIVLRFQTAIDSEFELYFDNSGWNGDAYRRFGINVRGRAAHGILWQGNSLVRGENLTYDPKLEPGVWYSLLLVAGKDGDLIAQLWNQADPATIYQFREKLGDRRTDLPWVFGIAANKGKVSIDSFAEIAFGGVK